MNYIHPKAEIDKNVKLGDNVSIWANAVLRADEGPIVIGNNTSIQESVVIHGYGTTIGNNVTVGHAAVIHGARIGSNVIIGINSTILDGVEIGDWVIVGAGTVLTPNTKVKSNTLVAGVPGKVIRELKDTDKQYIEYAYKSYLKHIKEKSGK